MLNESRDYRVKIQPLRGRKPKDNNRNWMIGDCLCIERVVLSAFGCFLAAPVRRGRPHLLALVLHGPAAGPFFGIHLYVGNYARHRGRQIRH